MIVLEFVLGVLSAAVMVEVAVVAVVIFEG
jgi:hypothetical protein